MQWLDVCGRLYGVNYVTHVSSPRTLPRARRDSVSPAFLLVYDPFLTRPRAWPFRQPQFTPTVGSRAYFRLSQPIDVC